MNVLPSSSSPQFEQRGALTIITLVDSGELRDGEESLTRLLSAHAIELAERHLVLDFTRVAWISSTELGTLILLHKRMAAHGGRLTLVNLRDEIYEVFRVTRLDSFLDIRRDK